MYCLGCDPGVSGAVVALGDDGSFDYCLLKCDRRTLNEFFQRYAISTSLCVIEKVHSFTGQGVKSTFTFGDSFGSVQQAAHLLNVDPVLVTPSTWQRNFGLVFPKGMGLSKVEKKNLHKEKAQEIAPHIKFTHALTDAFLIARYGLESLMGGT